MRLDKYLANSGLGSRKEVKKLIQHGTVKVNGDVIQKVNYAVDEKVDEVTYLNEPIHYQEYYYVMLNKPDGIISATEDREYETVVDWVALDYEQIDLFPVGRLDIDTTGLLLLTNNGQLAHQLLSPKKKVPKVYYAIVTGEVNEHDIQAFEKGLDLGDFTSRPASLNLLAYDEANNESEIHVEIYEGKFHQVKRMFEKVDKTVLTLHRISIGPLQIDPDLELGEYRELTPEEAALLKPYGLE